MIDSISTIFQKNDLAELIVGQVPEGLRIDYKRDLYGNSDADKREVLKDISGFANAFGGHLIVGMEEQKRTRNQYSRRSECQSGRCCPPT
ncbi:helix-turn-helix domain-containing protein [Undibacterium arcticum]